MKPILLKDIIRNINADCAYDGDTVITGVSTDTRTIKKGDLFVALVGDKFDGNDYVSVAEQNGAAAAVCSRAVEANIPILLVEDTLTGLQQLAAYYRSLLDIKVVAVTGSNGKTSTRDMITCVLSSKYRVYSTKKNFNNEIGLPKTLLEMEDDYDIAVLEMGMNHFGEISRLTRIAKPDVAVITNVGKAHIGNLGSQENILKAKLEILEGLKEDGLLIVNGDDAYLRTADTGAFEKQFIGISDASAPLLKAENITVSGTNTLFTVNGEQGMIPVLGTYNVLNALLAMCCGRRFGVTVREAFDALKHYQSVGMRCEAEKINGVNLVKDYYNSSPDSARVALEALGDYTSGGKRFALLGEMLELGEYSAAEHKTLAENCVKNGVSYAFFIGADCERFKEGMPENSQVFAPQERDEMWQAVKAFAADGGFSVGDAVLIKGSRGMKMEQFYESLSDLLKQQENHG